MGICINSLSLLAQEANVSVDNFTGTASVSVPLCVIRAGDAALPISLLYNGGGVKVKETEGTAGIGWHLIAGGEISREVRGLPDDQKLNNSYTSSVGWIYNNNGNLINNFAIANDNNNATCTDGTADLSYLDANFSNLSDTEPDMFYINVPGINCQIIFDKDNNIKTVPYQDIKVSYTTDSENPAFTRYGRITSFTITTTQGLKYVFSDMEVTTRTAATSLNPANIAFFKREFDQYRYGIEYASAWKLSNITDLKGNAITLVYVAARSRSANSRITLTAGTDPTPITPFSIIYTNGQKILDRIYYDDYDGIMDSRHSVAFKYTDVSTSSTAVISAVSGKMVDARFNYTSATTKESGSTKYKTFLTSVDINKLKTLSFDYNGLTINNTTTNTNKIDIPDSLSKEIDQWGYYNGSGATTLSPTVYIYPGTGSFERYRTVSPGVNTDAYPYILTGQNRLVNATTIINGSLKSITSYNGGTRTFVYEPNSYYDNTAGTVILGGGIRVKQLVNYDGINADNNSIINYSYINPSTGISSGKALSIPLLSFSRVYTGTGTIEEKLKNSTVRLEESVSPENNSIIYSHVKVSQSRAGSTLYEYSTPATYWDSSAAPDWSPTLINVAAYSCASVGSLVRAANTYPFVQNPNFDFERGLLKKVSQYNDNNEKLTESTYTYSRLASPTVVQGLKYEYLDGVGTYAKSLVNTNTDNVITQVQQIEYDAPSITQKRVSTVNRYYQSANHKLMTGQMTTASDGSISRTYIKYLKDYTPTSDQADPMNIALNNLFALNVNIPIESYNQLERNGINKTISGSLVKFKPVGSIYPTSKYMPSQKLGFVSSDGVSDFMVSYIGANVFNNDGRYTILENDLLYDSRGTLLTKDDNNKNVSTVLSDYRTSLPVAIFKNARADEIIFSDFESDGADYPSFPYQSSKQDSTSKRSGKYSYLVAAGESFSRIISKNTIARNSIFSIWIKSAGTGNVTITLTNAAGTSYTYPIVYANTSGQFKYYELKVPLANMSASFTVKYQASTAISVDDILFYADNAEVNTIGYDPDKYLKTSETNTNGIAQYFVYDMFKRLIQVLDQDKNIVIKNSYVKDTDISNFSAVFNMYAGLSGAASNFYPIVSSLDEGVTYKWNFGDGTAVVSTTSPDVTTHIYATAGSYSVTLTKVSPAYGTVSFTQQIYIGSPMVNIGVTNVGGDLGTITELRFYKGSTLMYTFSGTELTSSTKQIIADNYTVKISVTGNAYSTSNTSGYRRVRLSTSPSNYSNCTGSAAKTYLYELNVSLSGQTNLYVSVDNETCPVVTPGTPVE